MGPILTESRRLFIGLALPEYTQRELQALIDPIKGAAWTPPEKLHLTLRFLGETESPAEERLRRALAGIQVSPFLLSVEGLGWFPNQGDPRILWAGVGRGHPRLFQLQLRVEQAAMAAGFEPELRRFNPHITLARCAGTSLERIRQWAKHHADFQAAPIRVDSFGLYSSRLSRQGAVYHRELELPLAE